MGKSSKKAKIRVKVGRCGQQYGVMSKNRLPESSTGIKIVDEGQRDLHCAFGLVWFLEIDRVSRQMFKEEIGQHQRSTKGSQKRVYS